MVALIALTACRHDDPVVRGAPLGDVSLAEARLRLEGGAWEDADDARLGDNGVAVGDLDGDGLLDLAGTELGVGARVGLQRAVGADLVDLTGGYEGIAIVGGEVVLGHRYEGPSDRVSAVIAATTWRADSSPPIQTGTLFHAEPIDFGTEKYLPYRLRDLDGDGREELAVRKEVGETIWVLPPFEGSADLDEAASCRLIWADVRTASSLDSGDLDGDGLVDIVAGVTGMSGETAVVVPGPFVGDLRLDAADLPSIAGDWTYASGGDLDGDGRDDIVSRGDEGARAFAGPIPEDAGPDDAIATLLAHRFPDLPIASIAIAGDIDGDGFDDLLAGAPGDLGPDAGGVAAIWYGPPAGQRAFAEADARLIGEASGDAAGSRVLGPGDTDGDGYGDVVVNADESGDGRGAIYLLSGGPR